MKNCPKEQTEIMFLNYFYIKVLKKKFVNIIYITYPRRAEREGADKVLQGVDSFLCSRANETFISIAQLTPNLDTSSIITYFMANFKAFLNA